MPRDRKASKAFRVRRAQPVPPVLSERQEPRVLLDPKARPVQKELWAQPARLDPPARRAHRAT